MRLVQIGDYHIDADAVHVVSQTVSGQVMVHTPSGAVCVMGSTVAEVVVRLKRGPTPCETCRWWFPREGGEGLCTANGASQLNYQTQAMYVGCLIADDIADIGCPQHEEK